MMKRFLILLALAFVASSAKASTVTFSPGSQSITLGSTTTVDVRLGGFTSSTGLAGYDLTVLNNSSIIKPTSILFFSNLGDPSDPLSIVDPVLLNGSTSVYYLSGLTSPELVALQMGNPLGLFRVTYKGVGVGTSSLNLKTYPGTGLSDGAGDFSLTDFTPGSITVTDGGGGTPSTVPEPSTFVLLGSGVSFVAASVKRRRSA